MSLTKFSPRLSPFLQTKRFSKWPRNRLVASLFYLGAFTSYILFLLLASYTQATFFLNKDGHYELSLLILNILSTFTTLTTIILKFSGAQMPAPLLPMTFFIILTTISLATTSKLLQMRANRLAKAN